MSSSPQAVPYSASSTRFSVPGSPKPEQAVGHAEPASDIYSFAKLIVELLTGSRCFPDAALQLPARGRDMAQTLEAKLSTESIEMLATALEFDPAKRPNVAGLFASPIARDLELD